MSSPSNIKIRMESYDHEALDKSAAELVDTAKRTGARVAGRGSGRGCEVKAPGAAGGHITQAIFRQTVATTAPLRIRA